MNEQMILTYGDNGIEINVSYQDKKKKPVNIKNCMVEVTFVSPSSTKYVKDAYMLSEENGRVGILLDERLTSEEGLWTSYWSCSGEDGYVTAQQALYYFILPVHGGE